MQMSQKKAMKLLKEYNIKIPKTLIFQEPEISNIKLKYPLVLKVDSPEIIHKSDMGLVFTRLRNLHDVNHALGTAVTILRMHKITDYNFVLQETIEGHEIIMGMKRDPTFGPVILFGLGGVLVEIMKDLSMRVAPLRKKDCREMIAETKAGEVLSGYRNTEAADKEKIVDMLMNLSKLSIEEKNIQEIDFNPVIASKKASVAVDARVITKDA